MIVKVKVDDQVCPKAIEQLRSFSWPYPVDFSSKAKDHQVRVGSDGLWMCLPPGQRDVCFSWTAKLEKWKRDRSINHNLLKALKVSRGDQVVDATMGLGVDSSYLLHHGLQVLGFERHPLLHFLLQGSQLLCSQQLNLNIIYGQASEHLQERLPVYFDPMFEGSESRKAAAKKEMNFLHQLIGPSDDAAAQADLLRARSSRLVIKRSPRMEQLLPGRNSCWQTKAVRFDLYL